MAADEELEEARAKALKEAETIVADAKRRKADVESVISDLERRRDAVLAELDRLASGIAGAATEHRSSDEQREPSAEADGSDSDDTTVLARDAT